MKQIKAVVDEKIHQKQSFEGIEVKNVVLVQKNHYLVEINYSINNEYNKFFMMYSYLEVDDGTYLSFIPYDEAKGGLIPSSFLIINCHKPDDDQNNNRWTARSSMATNQMEGCLEEELEDVSFILRIRD